MNEHPAGLPGRLIPDDQPWGDQELAWPVESSDTLYASAYLTLRRDRIIDPSGQSHERAIVQPCGAVAVLALDDHDRVLLVDQYRHAVGRRMIELPAGMRDVDGESAQQTGARELAEEADVWAETWQELMTIRVSPGYTSEVIDIFRATTLTPIPVGQRTVREAEEADLSQWWVPLDRAVAAVLDGRITNGIAVSAILAEYASRQRS